MDGMLDSRDLAPIWRTGFCSHLSLPLGFRGGRERGLAAIPCAGLLATWHGVLSCRLFPISLFFSLRPRGSVYSFGLCSAAGKLSTLFNPRCRDLFSAYLATL